MVFYPTILSMIWYAPLPSLYSHIDHIVTIHLLNRHSWHSWWLTHANTHFSKICPRLHQFGGSLNIALEETMVPSCRLDTSMSTGRKTCIALDLLWVLPKNPSHIPFIDSPNGQFPILENRNITWNKPPFQSKTTCLSPDFCPATAWCEQNITPSSTFKTGNEGCGCSDRPGGECLRWCYYPQV